MAADALRYLQEQSREMGGTPLGQEYETAAAAAGPAVALAQDPQPTLPRLEEELRTLHEHAWTQLHQKTDRPLAPWREVFAVSCLMRCELEGRAGRPLEALRLVDLGLILGGPETFVAPGLFQHARSLAFELSESPSAKRPRQGRLFEAGTEVLPTLRRRCAQREEVDLETFLVSHFAPKTPLILRKGCAWPAVRRWSEESFWCGGPLGQRFVPVETDYWMDEGFKIMQLCDFVQHCSEVEGHSSAPSRGGYLAQHALFDQLPELEADILTPELALCGEGSLLRQVFFGPKGTVTPLHFDPYENIFCQVVGVKYLRLFPPSESENLYPREGDLSNNSRLEPADLLAGESAEGAYGDFPKLQKAEFQEAVLQPGDLLYLPMGWWHYVKSFSTSISIAFHFT
ncbi:unnamed protein product [Effrenium voratum]|uniref:JmjC domain-containing protein 5 n=1 Tax=Effrenium voratum TaxID=2562239 RepID=A0AA36NDB6_9DINO|nr:unnamed protein product [Effrenium voratum]CAJ1437187.1 unnamed protein product [Effrenium voratum]